MVELLVVMGIIALLAGMLMPALSGARQQANTVVCGSNVRQVAMAALSYAADNRGHYPPAHYDLLSKNLHRWHGTRTDPSSPFAFETSPLRRYLQMNGIRRCPVFEPDKAGFEASAGGYGYNNHYLGSSTADLAWAAGSENHPAKDAMVRRPAEKVMFADAAMAVKSGKGIAIIEYSFLEPPVTAFGAASPSIHFRHRGGKANVAFADGHVAATAMEWTTPTNIYGVSNEAAKLGWFGGRDNACFWRK